MPADIEVPDHRAFFSYSHRDRRAARRWHRRLEQFPIDPDLVGRATPIGPVPLSLSPIFRDRLDFPATGELGSLTRRALERSAALVLLASPHAARSHYVNEEVREFRHRFPDRPVVTIILDGVPNDPTRECFPPARRFALDASGQVTGTPVDLIAADPRHGADGPAHGRAKVVAGLTGLQPADVLTRATQRLKRERRWRLTLGGLVLCLIVGIGGAAWHYAETWSGNIAEAVHDTNVTTKDIKGDTRDLKADMARLNDSLAQLEAKQPIAAAGGPGAAHALADIRAMLRPDIPNIDAVSDEKLPGELQRILADARKPGAVAEGFDGAVANALSEARERIKVLALADARKGLAAAVAMARAEGQKVARGTAALLAESGRTAHLQLSYREAADFYTQASREVAFDSDEAWAHTLAAADELYAQGDEFGDNAALVEAIHIYRSFLERAPRDRAPFDWASTQNRLGMTLATLGRRESGTVELEEAVIAFRLALEEWTRDRAPFNWATAQNNLGAALSQIGARETGTARLDQAVTAFRLALEQLTHDSDPLAWAATQDNLGIVLRMLGEREKGTALLKDAVAAHRLALEGRSRDRVPLEWASAENNLANALESLGQRELIAEQANRLSQGGGIPDRAALDSGAIHLADAVKAYRFALEEWTRERAPEKWAMTQHNLGAALTGLGERESDTERLAEAIVAYRLALQVTTHDHAPRLWAETQFALGNALEDLALRMRDPVRLEEAVACMRNAVDVFKEGGDSYWLPIAENRIKEMQASVDFMKPWGGCTGRQCAPYGELNHEWTISGDGTVGRRQSGSSIATSRTQICLANVYTYLV